MEQSEPRPTSPQPVHKDICIERVIRGRKFRFRGFLREREECVLGDPMLERVRESGDTPTEKEDNDHLWKYRSKWVNDPELYQYDMVTNERHTEDPRNVLCISQGYRNREWGGIDSTFDRHYLVACRAA